MRCCLASNRRPFAFMLAAMIWTAISTAPASGEERRTFRVDLRGGGVRDYPAAVVGSYSVDDVPGRPWPFRQTYVTVVCARGGWAVALGPRDALALNGATSSLRSTGRIIDQHADELPIVGLSTIAEVRSARIVREDATTEAVNAVTDWLLGRALSTAACR